MTLPDPAAVLKVAKSLSRGKVGRIGAVAALMQVISAKKVVEVGVLKSSLPKKFMTWPAVWDPVEAYWMVDPWQKYGPHGGTPADWEQMAVEAYRLAVEEPKLRVMRLQSVSAATFFDRELNLVFVDGDHGYEPVKQDIQAWEPLIVPGGILCGHDYGNPVVPGVKQAVDELLGDRVRFLPDWQFKSPFAEKCIWYVEVPA